MDEQDIRIEARDWCGKIDTDRGASENQVENVALHFYEKARSSTLKEVLEMIDKMLQSVECNVDGTTLHEARGMRLCLNRLKQKIQQLEMK